MKRINITLLALMLLGILFSCTKASLNYTQNGNWVNRSSYPGVPMGFGASFTIGTEAYIGTGINPLVPATKLNTFFKYTAVDVTNTSPTGYDSALGYWTQRAPFIGQGRSSAVGFSIGDKGYLGTGLASDGVTVLYDFYQYDTLANAWTAIAPLKNDTTTYGRYDAVAMGFDTTGYVMTGTDNYYYFNDVWKYSPASNTWTQLPYFPGPQRSGAITWLYKGKGYLLTGYTSGSVFSSNGYCYDFWQFDPAKSETDPGNAWTRLRDIYNTNSGTYDDGYTNIIRKNGSGFVILASPGLNTSDKGYVTLGSNGTAINYTWEYDFATDLWTEKTPFEGSARSGAIGFTVKNRGFIATGLSSGNTAGYSDCREFYPTQIYNQYD